MAFSPIRFVYLACMILLVGCSSEANNPSTEPAMTSGRGGQEDIEIAAARESAPEPSPTPSASPIPTGPQFPAEWIMISDNPDLRESPTADSPKTRATFQGPDKVKALELVSKSETDWVRVEIAGREGWVPLAWVGPQPMEVPEKDLQKIGGEPVDRLHGISPEYVPPDLVALDSKRGYEDGRTYQVRKEVAEAAERMMRDAAEAGIKLYVVSGYRSYPTQRRIFLNKLARSDWNQKTVAKPGHSEHQLGTAIDFTDGDVKVMLRGAFGDTQAGRWLKQFGPDYGFAQSYTEANQEQTGYAPEPWHYRYYGIGPARKIHDAAHGN